MFCIIVVPRHPVIAQKCEKRVTVFRKSLFAFRGYFTLEIRAVKISVEAINVELMLLQKMSFQPMPIDGFHYGPQQISEANGDRLHLLVERVVQNLIVQIAHQVDETFLLRTGDCVVGRIEIRHQDTFEILQQRLDDFTLATLGKDIGHVVKNFIKAIDKRAIESESTDRLTYVAIDKIPGLSSDDLIHAALLHDIGHLPFSHVTEKVLTSQPRLFNIGNKSVSKILLDTTLISTP